MQDYDAIIIGGGPAGMSALIWCCSLNLSAVLLEKSDHLGGQMLQMFHRVFDYPGMITDNGLEMRDRFVSQLEELGLEWRTGCSIETALLCDHRVFCDGEWLQAKAIIIATGARRRRLGVPGEDRFEMRGVSFSGTRDHSLYAGKKVTVIGGGDSAIENALILARICPEVTLVHRRDGFRARDEWFKEARENPRINFMPFSEVVAIEGNEKVERLIIYDVKTGKRSSFETEAVFVKIGIAPNTELFRGQIDLDQAGFIKTGPDQKTSVDMVYAVGDVCNPVCMSVATAVGHGAVAAKAIEKEREGQYGERKRPDL